MHYVIIGNGVAGTTAAEHIRQIDAEGEITMISDEEYPFYSRIRLINFLSGEAGIEDITLKKPLWYKENRIELVLNEPVTAINKDEKMLMTLSGQWIQYDKLLLANGANSFIPPIPGSEKDGVHTLRRINDAQVIREFCKGGGRKVLLIGGGVLGLEAANALRKTGNTITVVEVLPRLLPRQMDPQGAAILRSQMEGMGFEFHIGVTAKEICGTDRASGVTLDNNTDIPCDIILVSAGIRSELTLAKELGLFIDKGVVVNDDMSTNIPDIFCAGDIASHQGRNYGLWLAAEQQGRVAGMNMAGLKETYHGTLISNVLKVMGIDLVSLGNIDAENENESFVYSDIDRSVYKKLVIYNNRIVGAILYGDKKHWLKVQQAIDEKKDISKIMAELKRWELQVL